MKVDSPWSSIVTVSCFLIHATLFGMMYSFGIFYVALLEDFPGQESATASIIGILLGTIMIASPLTITLSRRFTPRVVCCCGIVLASVSLYLASKATNLMTLYCTFGVMFGLATSFSYLPAILVLRTNFKKYLAVNYAIGISGTGVGGVVFCLVLPSVLETCGWRGCLRLLSYVTLGLTVCGLALTPCQHETDDSKPKKKSALKEKTGLKKLRVLIPSSWSNKAFVVLNIALILLYFVLPVPYCHIVKFAIEQGLSLSEGTRLPLVMTAGSTLGRLAIGPISSFSGISRISLLQAIFLILAVAITLSPLATSATLLIVYAGTFGVFDGAVNVLVPLVVDDVFIDPKQALQALGSLFAIFCIPYTLGSPLAGWLYSIKGSYQLVFFTCGAVLFLGACLLSLVQRLLPTSSDRKTFVDVPENIVVSSPSGDLPNPNPIPTNGRLMSLRMCSVLDLSADVFSETDNHGNDSCSNYYANNFAFVPTVYFAKSPNQTEPLSHFSGNYGISQNSSTNVTHEYTDIINQISGLTQSGDSTESLLNGTETEVPANIELGERDAFWDIDETCDSPQEREFEASSLNVAFDLLENEHVDNSLENSDDKCSHTQCSSSENDNGSIDSAYGSLDEFQDTFGQQGAKGDVDKPDSVEGQHDQDSVFEYDLHEAV